MLRQTSPVKDSSPAIERSRKPHAARRVAIGTALGVCAVMTATTTAASATQSRVGQEHRSESDHGDHRDSRPRTVVTTDMEQDDLASLIRYLLYTNDLDTEGIIYTSSVWHWAGPDNADGSKLYWPGRWVGSTYIQDHVLPAYAKVYPNLVKHDRRYPSPARLASLVTLGNIESTSEMAKDSDGSNLIKKLLLDDDRRPVYIQIWGGFNTAARALKSIEDQYSGTRQWARIKAKVSAKAVFLASGIQDDTYDDYIAPTWPRIRVEELSAGYATYGYNCNWGQGNTRGLPGDEVYFRGPWTKKNIQVGPLGSLYRSWLDGQSMPGDGADIFGDPVKAADGWCKPLEQYDFLSEGDDVAFMPLLPNGLDDPADPTLGGWGGRAVQKTTSPNFWTLPATEQDASGREVANYTTLRWAAASQNDFAARMRWTLTPAYRAANHAPTVRVNGPDEVTARPGQTVQLRASASDPDGDAVALSWIQYLEEGTLPQRVSITSSPRGHHEVATLKVPVTATRGQTISVVVQGTDSNPDTPLTRYQRITIRIA